MTFTLTPEQVEAFNRFKKQQLSDQPSSQTATGGRFSIEFTPTGLGTVIYAIDNQTDERSEITELLW